MHPDSDQSPEVFAYDLLLVNDNLASLVEGYELFETRVATRLVKLFLSHIEGTGASPRGNIVVCDGMPYQLGVDPVGFERELHVHFTPCGSSTRFPPSETKIDHFGRIRSIHIHWPEAMRARHEPLLDLMRHAARTAYVALQEMFIERYCELEYSLLNRLYEILNIRILEAEKTDLLNKSWLTVTTVATGQFQYFFGQRRLNHVATALTEHQVPQFSPFELLASLITEEAADTFWERDLITHDRFSALEFQKLSSISAQHRHWVAESNLYQDTSIAAREICTIDGYCVLLNCPAVVADELQPLATIAIPDLTAQFSANLKGYRGLRRAMLRLTEPVRHSGVYDGVKDWTTTTLAKIVAEIIKP